MAAPSETVVLRISIPVLKLQKAIRVNSNDLIAAVKKQLEEKVCSEIKDVLNYGLLLHGKDGKQGKYLDERNTAGSYHLDQNCQIDFQLKTKIGADTPDPKKQRKMLDDIQKGGLDKVKEKTTKSFDFNFLLDQETPIASAVMNNDQQMIMWLMDNGAFLDYRLFGAWVDVQDALGLTPIYYAATAGNSECVLRLLLAKANTENFDEHGRGPLHQAALNNFDCIVALLIDFGANIHSTNVGGNTPLHVAASRNSKESTKWLLMRGADIERTNKSGKRPLEVAMQAQCNEVCEIITKFKPEQIGKLHSYQVPPPPRYSVDNSEVDPIVQHMLLSLSSSIGGEYRPQIMLNKPQKIVQIAVGSLRKANSGTDHEVSENRKSLHKSMFYPPPPKSSEDSPKEFVQKPSHLSTSSSVADRSSNNSLSDLFQNQQKEEKLSVAWKKIAHLSPPPSQNTPVVITKLKSYVLEKSANNTDSALSELLSGLQDLEVGFIKAVTQLEEKQKENENLMKKLSELEGKS
ncbi:SH3 and multiple ankyrin repeat domains protein 2 [Boothiomyces sp. JEL0866]|nr:SH3 and multiple ankyrin repeat domains protein 2 [Boothiomyces sp. JEL0866]